MGVEPHVGITPAAVAVLVIVFVVAFVFVVAVIAIVFVVALFCLAVVPALECEWDRFHAFGEVEHRSAGFRNCFKRVLKALFEFETVGHYERGILHAGPVLQRGLVTVRVAADRDERLDVGQPSTGHVRDDVGPDARGDEDGRSGWRGRRRVLTLRIPSARGGTERHGGENCKRDRCSGLLRAAVSVNGTGAVETGEALHG